ncbi:MAG: hypothetical protein JXN64_13555 [Spirochaetes bacterium]|nr:hypothetical protein [Spirochaetota bacterium]
MNYAIARNIRKITDTIKRIVEYLKSIKYSEYYYQYLEYIRKLIEDFKGLSNLRFASFSYIPLFGWIFPLIMRKDNSYCTLHARQGFILSAMFIFIAMALNLINIFTPGEWREFRLGLVIFIYVFYFVYLIFCFIAASMVLKGKAFNIGFMKKIVDLIIL